MILYARLAKKRALENIFTLIKSSSSKREDTRKNYAKYLGITTKSKPYFICDYDEVTKYINNLKLGSGDLKFRLPSFVHNKGEHRHAERMFQEAMNSIRIKSTSLYDLLYIYIQKLIFYRLEGSIGGKCIDKPGISWVSPSINWELKDFEELLIFLLSLELIIVDGLVNDHFRPSIKSVHDYSVRPEIIHNQNSDYKLNFYSVFALKAVMRFRHIYGDQKEGHVFLSSSRLKILQKSYIDHIDESALTARGLELLFEIRS